ncbi:hypothetical protein GOBAR_AA15749 [Gossypium barbadense]|uniref:Uncharacterized protein n=1 Tax=Gossypium barbadense TaxID=3634 RepID=A0A2P5XNL3_GOSBA|nr:hypothetical protein GOBAR_AA15749 [Gossypium barbadense]
MNVKDEVGGGAKAWRGACGLAAARSTPVFLGRVGVHGHVAQPCLALFASPTPVFVQPRVLNTSMPTTRVVLAVII